MPTPNIKIIPGFSTGLSRQNNPNAKTADEDFADIKARIRQRDGYKCAGCGISAMREEHGLHVHHIDFNHENNSENNLVTLCRLCHGILHLDDTDKRRLPGNVMKAVWFPEITQAELNMLSWAMGIALFRGDKENRAGLAKDAEKLAQSILSRDFPPGWPGEASEQIFRTRIREDTDNPIARFCSLLAKIRNTDAKIYDDRERWLSGFRVFFDPREKVFQEMEELNKYNEAALWIPGSNWEDAWMALDNSNSEKD